MYNPDSNAWTKHNFSLDVQFSSKPDWFLVSILGDLNLFLPNDTFMYQSESKTWTKSDLMIDFPIDKINFLRVAYE